MSTAANEDLLIEKYRDVHAGLWNGQGFGPKDPGQERDTTTPSFFDRNHPIRLDLQLGGIEDNLAVGVLCANLKATLPYVFRYKLDQRQNEIINLSGIERSPKPLLQTLINHLGAGSRGAILSYGIVIYPNQKSYPFGEVVDPQ